MTTAAPAFRYVTGGTLLPDAPSYITRPCDAELLHLCRRGEFAYVLSSRQMGKSSLMARTVVALVEEGLTVAAIDLTTIGSQAVTAEQWYLGVLTELESACMPQTDLFSWWEAHTPLPLAQRLWCYITEVLLPEVPGRIVVLVDEIDSTLSLDFTDDFFALIRALHNQRAQGPEFERLSFVLLGVATPAELIRDASRTPFNIGQRVEVTDFSAEEARPLLAGLAGESAEALLARVLYWTGGQPFLTQKLCALLSAQGAMQAAQVDALVDGELLSERGRGDAHFQFVADYLLKTPAEHQSELFDVCAAVLRGRAVVCLDASLVHNRLRLAGLMRRVDGRLVWRNEVYRRLFGWVWVRQNRPTFWTKANKTLAVVTAAAVLVAGGMFTLYQRAETATEQALAAEGRASEAAVKATAEAERAKRAEATAVAAKAETESQRNQALAETKRARLAERRASEAVVQATAAAERAKRAEIAAVRAKIETEQQRDQAEAAEMAAARTAVQAMRAEHKALVAEKAAVAQKARAEELVLGVLAQRVLRDFDDISSNTKYAFSGIKRPLLAIAAYQMAQASKLDYIQASAYSAVQVEVLFRLRDTRRIIDDQSNSALRVDFVKIPNTQASQIINRSLPGDTGWIRHMAFSPDGKMLAGGGSDGVVRLWSAQTGQVIGQPLRGSSGEIHAMEFSPDSGMLAIASDEVRLWNAQTGLVVGSPLQGHEGPVVGLAFSADGKMLATVGVDKMIRLWKVKTGQQIGQPLLGHTDAVWNAVFSPDGEMLASGGSDGSVRLWDVRTSRAINLPVRAHGGVSSVAFSPNGKVLAISGFEGVIRLWDTQTGLEIGRAFMVDYVDEVLSIAFSPDGKHLAYSVGTQVILRDLYTRQMIGQPLKHSAEVLRVAFSPDGRILAGGSDGKNMHLSQWPAPATWADLLCAKLPRNMSHKEWREWISPEIPYMEQCPGLPVPAD